MKLECLNKNTLEFIKLNGFTKLTRIQDASLELALSGKDLVALSKTGTGKTHAFLIPLLEIVDASLNELQAIISVPTRELAFQIYEKAKLMQSVNPDLRIKLVSGGTDRKKSFKATANSPHIIIGTPGRIKDLYVENILRMDKVKVFVIDEADMTLEYGFLLDIDVVLASINKPQVMCFSATLAEGLKPFISKYLNNPQVIKIEDNAFMNPKIKHYAVNAKHKKYAEALLDVLPSFNPYVCLIFANTRQEAKDTTNVLKQAGYRVLELHGGLEARERKQAIKALSNHEYSYVVCSDVASRGLDIEGVSHVVSLGLPSDISFFTHRIGRTGRAGKEGYCFTIYRQEDVETLRLLDKQYNFELRTYKNGHYKIQKSFVQNRITKSDIREKEISKILNGRKEKVKPNYKKKKTELIKKIKQKEKREFIRSKIKEVRKERYKKLAREKYQSIKGE